MRASVGAPVHPAVFELASQLMAKARALEPADEALRGPMPMIEYLAPAINQTEQSLRPPEVQGVTASAAALAAPTGAGLAVGQSGCPQAPARIQLPAKVQAANLLARSPQPIRPKGIKITEVTGDEVRFAAIVARDGTVASLTTVTGNPLLIPAAMEAAKQWVYLPTLLNGCPVEVSTEIVVSFPPD
jgi:hypothetical protein